MKYLLSFSLLLPILFLTNSCGDDAINSVNTAPDFDIYLVKRDFQNSIYSTYTIKGDGTNLKLLNDSMLVNNYSFNNKILLSKRDYYTDKVYIACHDGSNMTEITLGREYYSYFNLSPDANKVCFIADNPGYFLYIINTDGTDLTLISDYNYNSPNIAKFSPNSKLIAYYEPSFHQFSMKLFISNTSGTYKKLIKDSINSRAGISIDWSPNGDRLFFQHYSMNEQVVRICAIDTTGNHYSIIKEGLYPELSSVGDKICFINYIGTNRDIYLMNVDGTNIVNISNTPGIDDFNHKWSKDGTKVLFTSGNPPDLWMYDLNTNTSTFIIDSVYDAIWQ